MLGRYAPLCEVGAGTGYWGLLLRARGVECLCYDANPPEPSAGAGAWSVECAYTHVLKADGVAAAKLHPTHTLLLIWPYIDELAATGAQPSAPWDAMTLASFRGQVVAHVGELNEMVRRSSRMNTSPEFCTALHADWELECRVRLTNWAPMMVSELTIWRRRS